MEEFCGISIYQSCNRTGREGSVGPYLLTVEFQFHRSAESRVGFFCLSRYLVAGPCRIASIEGLYGKVYFTVLLEQIVYDQFIGILADLFSV